MKKNLPDVVMGLLLGCITWIVYLSSLSEGAAPGPSAGFLLYVLDLFPRMAPESPLWYLLARGLAGISGSGAVQVLNGFSAFCAAVAVGLLYAVVRNGIQIYFDPYLVREGRARWISALAGFVAAAGLGFSAPFWSVANRAHMLSFDVLLLLLAAWLLVSFLRTGRFGYAVILSASYGLLAAEFTTFIVIGPMFALGLLYGLWRHELLLARRLALLAVLLLAGIVAGYLVTALVFMAGPGYALRDYQGFWNVLWLIWRDQLHHITRSLPREGWLIILVTTTVPWLAMFAVARRALNDDRDKALVFLHLVMTVFVLAVWLHVPLTPWRLMGWQRLLVTPYILVAMVSGYLAAFWFLLAGGWHQRREEGWLGMLQFVAGQAVVLVLVGATVVAPWWFKDEAQPRGSRVAREVAGEVVASLGGREWLVSDGDLDAHYYLAAWERGQPLRILSLPSSNNRVYQRYVASLFDEVHLQNAALLSLHAFLREWLSDPAAAAQVAILHAPDLWRRAGYEAVPQQMVYVGEVPGRVEIDAAAAQRATAFLASLRERLDGVVAARDPVADSLVAWAVLHAGRLGNDLAVLLEDAGLDAQAGAVYQAVRQLDPDNISALLNLATMATDGRIADPEGRISGALETLAAGLSERLQIWSLARTYGTVRSPEAFAQMGWNWAYSGQSRMAVAQVERAVALQGEAVSQPMEALMAEVYLLDNRPLESAAIYRGMLAREKQRLMGLAGLYRIALRERQLEEARGLLAQLAEAGMPGERVILEDVLLDLLQGRAEAARARLEDFLVTHRDALRGWVLLAEAGFALGQPRLVDRALRRIELLEGGRGYYAGLIRARQAFQAHDYALAAEHYEAALRRRPGHVPLIEELLRLNLLLQRRDAAQRHMRALLHADPQHALALYVRGSLQIADGDYRLAEDSLRRSLGRSRLPMALNDLAWLLVQREAYEEAEVLVREALQLQEQQAVAWDTLGVILMRTGRLEEAEAAFSRSSYLETPSALVLLHQAELQLRRGRKDAAREILGAFEGQTDRLRDVEQTLWLRLRDEAR